MRLRVARGDVGLRLDALLTARGAASSRAEAQRLIGAGAVTVDGVRRQKSHRAAEGEVVEVSQSEPPEPPAAEEVPFEVVHEDDHLMVIDKPAGVVVHPGAGRREGTLAQALLGRAAGGPDPARASIVHHLDRDTSGLMLVAKSDEAHERLSRMIRRRVVERGYLALVEGHPDARSGTIDAPLGRDPSRRTAVSTRAERARPAITHFSVEELLPRTALLAVRLETGRTHQIRAHLAAIGHPVAGDARYGGATAGRRLGLERQFLHARSLMFSHPFSRESFACESKPPADLLHALDAARREPVSGGPDGG
jgi:23S rRNA pseudouridine1911/1915/1917 synthase